MTSFSKYNILKAVVMKGDEKLSLIGQINDMLRMPDVARFLGFEPDKKGFIKSPFHPEKTASCKLYDGLGKGFYDFSSGTSGDCIRFTAITQNIDNWQAAKLMVEAFNLPVDMKNTNLTRQKVQQLKQQREADQKRKAVDQKKWVAEMDSLKTVIATCEDVLTNPHIEPMSDLWCSAVEQRNKSIIRANEMVGVETTPEDLKLPRRERQVG